MSEIKFHSVGHEVSFHML